MSMKPNQLVIIPTDQKLPVVWTYAHKAICVNINTDNNKSIQKSTLLSLFSIYDAVIGFLSAT